MRWVHWRKCLACSTSGWSEPGALHTPPCLDRLSSDVLAGLQHKLIKHPIGLSSQAGIDGPSRRAPGFSEHTEAVLKELGYSDAQVVQLRGGGVVT